MKKYVYTHCNSNANDYHIQTNNARDPFITCFPTSMINWAKINGLNPDRKLSKYKQPEDEFDAFIHDDPVMISYVNKLSAQPWVRDYLEKGGDVRELWDVEVYGINKWLGEDHAKANYNLSIQDIVYEIQSGRSIVTTGEFCEYSHAVTIVGFKALSNTTMLDKDIELAGSNMSFPVDGDRFTLTDIIILDSYGNPNDKYSVLGKGGFNVVIPIDEFLSRINKGSDEQSIYYGITYI